MTAIVGLSYISLYIADYDASIAFYTRVFGEPGYREEGQPIVGWHLGNTWLTVFDAAYGPAPGENPRGTEFAVQVQSPQDVDALYGQLIASGALSCREPEDTWMYESMRFACVDDPFGVRIDVYAALPE